MTTPVAAIAPPTYMTVAAALRYQALHALQIETSRWTAIFGAYNREKLMDFICQEIPILTRVGAELLIKSSEKRTNVLNLTTQGIIAAMPLSDILIETLLVRAERFWPPPEPCCSLSEVLYAMQPFEYSRINSRISAAVAKMNREASTMCSIATRENQVPYSVACCCKCCVVANARGAV